MKQITRQHIQELIFDTEIDLSSTHARLCIPIIDRIARKMSVGINFPVMKVSEALIIDGHHRYIASLLTGFPLEQIPTLSTCANIIVEWESVVFVDEDWDTPAKIKMLNELDADYNNISIDEIAGLLS